MVETAENTEAMPTDETLDRLEADARSTKRENERQGLGGAVLAVAVDPNTLFSLVRTAREHALLLTARSAKPPHIVRQSREIDALKETLHYREYAAEQLWNELERKQLELEETVRRFWGMSRLFHEVDAAGEVLRKESMVASSKATRLRTLVTKAHGFVNAMWYQFGDSEAAAWLEEAKTVLGEE